ncbi:Two-component response regulator [Melia azedarach]|uniref:Two-component response regulator n=1 Tax=Melia azedarach TaxID=155640 RepID=A0ACC1XUZ3_MELAZ|nr:Two-component response regulator [Melia azedarach]
MGLFVAIGKLKKEVMQCTEAQEQPEVEEVIASKRNTTEGVEVNDLSDKREWMSSFQLWSSDINFDHKKKDSVSEVQLRRQENNQPANENPIELFNCWYRDGAFVPFKEQIGFARTRDNEVSQAPGLSLMMPALKLDSREPKKVGRRPKWYARSENNQQQRRQCRKVRRSWSNELHRLFVDVLNHLGGCHAATPKQIRQLMRVDGLTNDEIKSHLQKYRLYLHRYENMAAGTEHRPWMPNDQFGDDSNPGTLHCNSPQSSVLSRSGKEISTTGGTSMGAEEDARSDGHSWNGKVYMPTEVDVQSRALPINFAGTRTSFRGNQLINIDI